MTARALVGVAFFIVAISLLVRMHGMLSKMRQGRKWDDPSALQREGYIGNYDADMARFFRAWLLCVVVILMGVWLV